MSATDREPAQRSGKRRTVEQADKQASDRQLPAPALTRARDAAAAPVLPDDQRDVVWELHLRGVPKARIAVDVGLHRETVAKFINEGYRAFGAERKARLKRGLDAAVARMRRIQRQAWDDHDADDARERQVLEASEPGSRYTSQRASYLRLALDAEKEIARLEGLYAEDAPDVLGVLFQVERIERVERVERVVVSDDHQRRPDASDDGLGDGSGPVGNDGDSED